MKKALVWTCLWAGLVGLPAHALNDALGPPPPEVDRSNPHATVQNFLQAAHEGKYDLAAHFLYLDHLGKKAPEAGPVLARRLRYVLDRKMFIDFAALSKEPQGNPEHPNYDQIGTIALGNTNRAIRVTRFDAGDGNYNWVFSPDTVRSIDKLYQMYGPPLGDRIPDAFFQKSFLQIELWQWIGLFLAFCAATLVALIFEWVVLWLLSKVSRFTSFRWDDDLVLAAKGPLKIPLWALLFAAGTRKLVLSPSPQHTLDGIARSITIVSLAWFILRAIDITARALEGKAGNGENESARMVGVRTQVAVLRRLLGVVTYIVAGALLLMQFDVVRNVGVSLLASAGLAGLIVGVAAQKSISTLLAGIQLTLTQPIRLGDTVVVEGESGTVEEITLTYVIVKAWDGRRLIVPMTYFLDKPFQNWSKGGSELASAVTLLANKNADVEVLRGELNRILQGDARPFWDGRIPNLVVTETASGTLVMRALVGAVNPAANGPLRQKVQHGLEAVLQRHPDWVVNAFGSADPAAPPGPAQPSSH
jgi:small-conductance mechanosensitive channel